MKTTNALVVIGAGLVLAISPMRGRADSPPVLDVTVDTQRVLPRVWVLPADDASTSRARELVGVLALAGVYDPILGKVGQEESGFSVRVKTVHDETSNETTLELDSGHGNTGRIKRLAKVESESSTLDLARAADGIVKDLSGERSHLSGWILFTDTSRHGHRSVHRALATGDAVTQVSPADGFAREGDFGPGGSIYFAMSRKGEVGRLFSERDANPLPLRLSGEVQGVALSRDAKQMAIVAGTESGSTLYTGEFLGDVHRVSQEEVAMDPSFGPSGELVFVAGPARGPLRVLMNETPLSPAGVWAESPSFCNESTHRRVLYGATDGQIRLTDLNGSTQVVAQGQSPVCSPDGRAVMFVRQDAHPGIYVVGVHGGSPIKIRDGAASDLRWSTGRPLPITE